ncbi:MAG TPA: alkaline phosphatase [Chloroflexota bacterium]
MPGRSLREVVTRGVTRRRFFRAGGAGVATAVISGIGVRPAGVAPGSVAPAAASRAEGLTAADLRAVDPHLLTARSLPFAQLATPAVRILPIARAKLLAGARFDLRVEAMGLADPNTSTIRLEVSGPNGPESLLSGEPVRTSSAPNSLEVVYPNLNYARAGRYTITASVESATGDTMRSSVDHEVVLANANGGKKARNVIFFLGDGMGQGPITAARILSQGISEGKYFGLLDMDRMDYRGIVTTSGVDAIATDSANSMSAYMTGHKASVNALGVYEGLDPDPKKHPRVETMAELLKRTRGMAIGVVSTAEIQDATPAAVWAHTRRRSEYADIMDQALNPAQMPDVILGGGSASLLPQSENGSRRTDERNLFEEFRGHGFVIAQTGDELRQLMQAAPPGKLLGLFHTGNMNVYLDRQHRKDPQVLGRFPDQPTLMDMTQAALNVLQQSPNGFFLMVEGASIDKMEHPLDWPRAVYDTIELDKAVGVARRWAEQHGNDTLIVGTADHNHAMSVIGTNTRSINAGRQGNGVYADAGFPDFRDSDGDGFPDDPDPNRTLFIGWSNHPDYYDNFRLDARPVQPAMTSSDLPAGANVLPNSEHDPDAELQLGNLPLDQSNAVHTVDDVPIVASGPGAARFNATLDNTEVFFAIMDALGIDARA